MSEPRLTAATVQILRDTIEAEFACGSRQVATALELLLEWYDRRNTREAILAAHPLVTVPAGDVYSRSECVYAKCPTPAHCKARDVCAFRAATAEGRHK